MKRHEGEAMTAPLPECPLCGSEIVGFPGEPEAWPHHPEANCIAEGVIMPEPLWRLLAAPPKRRMAIPLGHGHVAWVDEEDYEAIAVHRWTTSRQNHGTCYARRTVRENGEKRTIFMHRVILGEPQGFTDHIDGDGLNNTRANLRVATALQNSVNAKARTGCVSRFKGVQWAKKEKKWRVSIRIDGAKKSLGYFDSEEEAASVYAKKAFEIHGEFGRPR